MRDIRSNGAYAVVKHTCRPAVCSMEIDRRCETIVDRKSLRQAMSLALDSASLKRRDRSRIEFDRECASPAGQILQSTLICGCGELDPILGEKYDNSAHGLREAYGARDHGVECRPDVGRRSRHDAQHIACGGLVFERFLCFVEEPYVFDRDHRLIG